MGSVSEYLTVNNGYGVARTPHCSILSGNKIDIGLPLIITCSAVISSYYQMEEQWFYSIIDKVLSLFCAKFALSCSCHNLNAIFLCDGFVIVPVNDVFFSPRFQILHGNALCAAMRRSARFIHWKCGPNARVQFRYSRSATLFPNAFVRQKPHPPVMIYVPASGTSIQHDMRKCCFLSFQRPSLVFIIYRLRKRSAFRSIRRQQHQKNADGQLLFWYPIAVIILIAGREMPVIRCINWRRSIFFPCFESKTTRNKSAGA